MILVTLFLVMSMTARILTGLLPEREPPGTEEFLEEARAIMAILAKEDSLQGKRGHHSADSGRKGAQFPRERHGRGEVLLPGTIDLNEVDSAGLLPLPGIGPVFAGRITRYRALLGGYHHTGQLTEVYGLKQETVERIAPYFLVDTGLITRINLSNAAFRELLRHPYLNYEDVKALVNYRELMGAGSTIQDIRHNRVLPDTVLERIAPYLDLDVSHRKGP